MQRPSSKGHRTRRPSTHHARPAERSLSVRLEELRVVLVVLRADVLADLPFRMQHEIAAIPYRLGENVRVRDDRLVLDRVRSGPAVALDDAHLLGVSVAADERAVVEADDLDDERIPFPARDG